MNYKGELNQRSGIANNPNLIKLKDYPYYKKTQKALTPLSTTKLNPNSKY